MKLVILTGGQTGVDRGAHLGAIDGGLPIAGWMPRAKHDELGPIPDDVAKYLLPCTIGSRDGGHPARTSANVEWATHVCLVVQDCRKIASTRGTALTWSLAKDERFGRPWIGVDPDIPTAQLHAWVKQQMGALADAGELEMRLLVAGPRASSWSAPVVLIRGLASGFTSSMTGGGPLIAKRRETALTALQASETGHIVLSTMHSEKVADTMERYLNLFPAEDAKHGTDLLANQLSGVLCQKLVPSADGGLHLLVEHVENAGAMRDWIARRELHNIDQYISRGSDPAAVSFLQSTVKALQAKVITEATAMASVSNESELRRAMRGIV